MKKREKKRGSMFYASTRELKLTAFGLFCAGTLTPILIARLSLILADTETYSAFITLVGFFEIMIAFTMGLLIYIFADMLECWRHIQNSVDKACATLKKESESVESADAE